MPHVIKDPDSHLDYTVSWKSWLDLDDVLSTVTWLVSTIAGDAAPLTTSSLGHDDNMATVWFTGGSVGNTYTVTCRITTSDGRAEDFSFTVVCQER